MKVEAFSMMTQAQRQMPRSAPLIERLFLDCRRARLEVLRDPVQAHAILSTIEARLPPKPKPRLLEEVTQTREQLDAT